MGIGGTTADPSYFDATVVVTNNEWRHVAATYDGANAQIYVDGVLDTTYPSTGQITNSTYSLYIGENSQATGRHITGLIDDVRVYRKALTAAEIAAAMRGDPTLAWNPNPANNSTADIEHAEPVTWTPGEKAAKHDVYFGTDMDAVEDADTTTTGVYRGRIDPNSYTPPEGVQVNETYYWRIDEYNTDTTISEGRIWSFTVADYLIIEDFEDYDDYCNRIFYTWPDGWGHNGDLACGVPPFGGNGTGSTVGYLSEPYAEQTITHDGSFQSMPFEFLNDGSTGKALYSETERTFEFPRDFTRKGMKSLTLWYQGQPGSVGSFSYDAPTDIYTMTGSGTDIWDVPDFSGAGAGNFHDEFHYAYKQLSGVGSIQVKVLSVDNTNTWAKAGVMIRETLDANSVHTMTVITPGQGVSFQRRPVTAQASEHTTLAGFQAPYWVRITRSGNDFTSEHSADGATWETIGTQNIPMAATVYVGLALTSHNAGATCEATFSDVTISGTVTGQWQSQDIGIASNDAERLYVVLEDSTGTVKDVPHPDPNAVQLDTWQEWNVDLAAFAPVDLTRVKKVYIGVGNRNAPALGGGGMLYIDDIRLYAARCIPSLVKPAADFNNNCIVDYPDLDILADNWLRTIWDPTGGHDGGSLAFGPTGDYVAIEDLSYNSTGLTAVSVSAWIRTDSEADQYIASFDRNEYWRLEINGSGAGPGQVGWDVMTDTGQVDYGSATRVDDGLWHHVVGVFDNGTLTIYIDGIAESPATGGATFGTGATRFGFLGANSEATVFDGARGGGNPVQHLDDFRIYDYALSAADVTSLAQGTAEPATGPILWYKLDETSGNVAADSSGNGYDGHLMFSWFEINLHDDTTINFKDYAILADTFLDEILWP
jgi:regulation of enolase protein 1 (concanavalin A-like superfamily)